MTSSMIRTRWAAIGAAVAVTLGAGGISLVGATSPGDAATFVPITPCRVIDTRPGFQVGPRSAPLAANDTSDVSATGTSGNCSAVPTSASGVVLNVTAVDATMPTFLTIWETAQPRPDASSLNPSPGQAPTPNAVTTAINGDGEFSIYNYQGTVHVLADVVGYYTDHHHDDRYYTKTQTAEVVDAAIEANEREPWQIHIAPSDLDGTAAMYQRGATTVVYRTGRAFDDVFGQVAWLGFTVPESHPPGTDIHLDVDWVPDGSNNQFVSENAVGCQFRMSWSPASVSRAGDDQFHVDMTWETPALTGGTFATLLPLTQAGFDGEVASTYGIIDGSGIEPGDDVTTRLNRLAGGADTCDGEIVVTGITARPAD